MKENVLFPRNVIQMENEKGMILSTNEEGQEMEMKSALSAQRMRGLSIFSKFFESQNPRHSRGKNE